MSWWNLHGHQVISTIVFSVVGSSSSVSSSRPCRGSSPSPEEGDGEDQNVALAIVIGSIVIGFAIIIAASVAAAEGRLLEPGAEADGARGRRATRAPGFRGRTSAPST